MSKARMGFTLVKQGDKGPRSFKVSRDATTGRLVAKEKTKAGSAFSVSGVADKDKEAIRSILAQHAVGLRNLADR